MTVTHLPLPTTPLPKMTPCAGMWDLFDSRRDEDHWRARRICERCPIKDDCKPPEKIIVPSFPGAMGRPSEGTVATADGTWGGRLYRNGIPVDVPCDFLDVEACSVCKARPNQSCMTPDGRTRAYHKGRTMPRMCSQCGRAPADPRSAHCSDCRVVARQRGKALYEQTQRRRKKAA